MLKGWKRNFIAHNSRHTSNSNETPDRKHPNASRQKQSQSLKAVIK